MNVTFALKSLPASQPLQNIIMIMLNGWQNNTSFQHIYEQIYTKLQILN